MKGGPFSDGDPFEQSVFVKWTPKNKKNQGSLQEPQEIEEVSYISEVLGLDLGDFNLKSGIEVKNRVKGFFFGFFDHRRQRSTSSTIGGHDVGVTVSVFQGFLTTGDCGQHHQQPMVTTEVRRPRDRSGNDLREKMGSKGFFFLKG